MYAGWFLLLGILQALMGGQEVDVAPYALVAISFSLVGVGWAVRRVAVGDHTYKMFRCLMLLLKFTAICSFLFGAYKLLWLSDYGASTWINLLLVPVGVYVAGGVIGLFALQVAGADQWERYKENHPNGE
tara:strand:+ start:287 stop:676 length:390 start_codon:yes stop_codon:yes gene_type:complete